MIRCIDTKTLMVCLVLKSIRKKQKNIKKKNFLMENTKKVKNN